MSMSPTRAQYAALNSPVECFAPPASCKPGHKKPVKGKGESFPPCFELEEENARSQIEKQKTPGNAFRLRSSSHAHRDVVVAFPLLLTRHNSFPRRTKNGGYPCADSDSVADDFTQSDMSALLAPSSASVSPRVVVATFRVQARDVEEVWVWHFTLAARARAEVEVESRTSGGAVVVSTSCVVGVAGSG